MEQFQLEGSDGETHEYRVNLHPASDGARIAIKLYSLAGEPIGELIQTYVKSEGLDLDSEDGAQAIMAELDFAEVAGHVREALVRLDTDDLLKSLFQNVKRDGEDMANRTYFDQAYRGNYGEMFKAAWRVIKVNGFLHSFGTFMGG